MFAMSEGREAPWPLNSSSCKGGVGGGSMGIVVGGPCVETSPRLVLAALKSPDKLPFILLREGAAESLLAELIDRACSLLLRSDRFESTDRSIGTRSSKLLLSAPGIPSDWDESICARNDCCGVAERLAALLECPGPGDPIS